MFQRNISPPSSGLERKLRKTVAEGRRLTLREMHCSLFRMIELFTTVVVTTPYPTNDCIRTGYLSGNTVVLY
jgi:hypothetical protein